MFPSGISSFSSIFSSSHYSAISITRERIEENRQCGKIIIIIIIKGRERK
jgi:hypothetical protein